METPPVHLRRRRNTSKTTPSSSKTRSVEIVMEALQRKDYDVVIEYYEALVERQKRYLKRAVPSAKLLDEMRQTREQLEGLKRLAQEKRERGKQE